MSDTDIERVPEEGAIAPVHAGRHPTPKEYIRIAIILAVITAFEVVVYYLEGARVRGVLLWNTWEQVDAARALIAQPGPFRPGELKGRLPAT